MAFQMAAEALPPRGVDASICRAVAGCRGCPPSMPVGDDHGVVEAECVDAALPLALGGGLAEARRMVDPIVRSLDTAPEADVVGFMVPNGLIHLWDGDLDGAVRWFERGVQPLAAQDLVWTAGRCFPRLVKALRLLGGPRRLPTTQSSA